MQHYYENGGEIMTDMKRMTISFTDELDAAILELRKTDEFKNANYSKIVRYLVEKGLAVAATEK